MSQKKTSKLITNLTVNININKYIHNLIYEYLKGVKILEYFLNYQHENSA